MSKMIAALALVVLVSCIAIPTAISQIGCADVDDVETPPTQVDYSVRVGATDPAAVSAGFIYSCTLTVYNEATSEVNIAQVKAIDNLFADFITTAGADSVHFLAFGVPTGSALSTNSNYTGGVNEGSWPGDAGQDSLADNTDTIVVADSGKVVYTIYFEPGTATPPIENTVTMEFADPDGDGNPASILTDSFTHDVYWPTSANVAVTYEPVQIIDRGTGEYDVDYRIIVDNPGLATLDTLQVYNDIETIFSGSGVSLDAISVTSARGKTTNVLWGTLAGQDSIYQATATMAPGVANRDTLLVELLVTAPAGTDFTNVATAYANLTGGTAGTSASATTGNQTVSIPTPVQPGSDQAIYAEVLAGQDNFVIGMMPFPVDGANAISQNDFEAGTWQIQRSGTPVDPDSVSVELFEDGMNIYPNGNVRGVRYSFFADHGTGVGTYELVNTASAQSGFTGSATINDLHFDILVGFDKDGDGDYFENDAGADVDTMSFGPAGDVAWSTTHTLFTGDTFTLPDNGTYAWTYAEKAHADTTDLKIIVWCQHQANGKQRVWFTPWNDREFTGDMTSYDNENGTEFNNWKWYNAPSTGQVLDFEIRLRDGTGTYDFAMAYATSMNLPKAPDDTLTVWTKARWDTTAYVSGGGLTPFYAAQLRGGHRAWMECLSGTKASMASVSTGDPGYTYCDAARYVESKFPAMFMEEYDLPAVGTDSIKNWFERHVYGSSGVIAGHGRWDDVNHQQQNAFHRNPRDHGAYFIDDDTAGTGGGGAPQPYHLHALGGEYNYDKEFMTHALRAASSGTAPAGRAKSYYMWGRQECMVGVNVMSHFTDDFENNPKPTEFRISDVMKGFPDAHPSHTSDGNNHPHTNDNQFPNIGHWAFPAAILAYQVYSLPYMRDEHAWLEFSYNRRCSIYEGGSPGNSLGDQHWKEEERASGYLFRWAQDHLLFESGDTVVEGHLRTGIPATWENDEHGITSGNYALTTRTKPWMHAQAFLECWNLAEMWGIFGNSTDSTLAATWGERGADWIVGRGIASSAFTYEGGSNPWDSQPEIDNSVIYQLETTDGPDAAGAMPWGAACAAVCAGLGHPEAKELYVQSMKYPSYYTGSPPSSPTVEESNSLREQVFRLRAGMRYLVVGDR